MMLAIPDTDHCTACGETPLTVLATQLPLLYHGGYGHATRRTITICLCRATVTKVEATNPRKPDC